MISIKETSYRKYQLDWLISHGYTVYDLLQSFSEDTYDGIRHDEPLENLIENWENNTGFDGSIWACYDEFLEAEYQDAQYMSKLLTKEEFNSWCIDIGEVITDDLLSPEMVDGLPDGALMEYNVYRIHMDQSSDFIDTVFAKDEDDALTVALGDDFEDDGCHYAIRNTASAVSTVNDEIYRIEAASFTRKLHDDVWSLGMQIRFPDGEIQTIECKPVKKGKTVYASNDDQVPGIKFRWDEFNEGDFVNYCSMMENNLLHKGDVIGFIRCGELCFDLKLLYDPRHDLSLCMECYVGGVDSGYAYSPADAMRSGKYVTREDVPDDELYPYDIVGDIHVFNDSMIWSGYDEFKKECETAIMHFIRTADYKEANLEKMAMMPLHMF